MRRPRIAASERVGSGGWTAAAGGEGASERVVVGRILSPRTFSYDSPIFSSHQPTSDSDTYAAVTVAAGATDAASAAYSPRIRSTSMSTMHAELCVLLAAFTGDRSHSDTPKNKTVAL